MPGSSAGASAPHHPARVAHSLGSWFLNLAVDGGHASDRVTDPADPQPNLAIDRQANEERNEAEERSEDVFKWTLLVGIVAVASTIAIGEQLERRHMHRPDRSTRLRRPTPSPRRNGQLRSHCELSSREN